MIPVRYKEKFTVWNRQYVYQTARSIAEYTQQRRSVMMAVEKVYNWFTRRNMRARQERSDWRQRA